MNLLAAAKKTFCDSFAKLKHLAAFAVLASLVVAGPAVASVEGYRLAPGDIVTFDFLDDAEIPVPLTISNDGDAQFPLIGAVRVQGLTVPEALEKLREEYRDREILMDPKLALNIATFRPVFVLGDVKSPGSFPYYSGLTVEQAVGLAGGQQTAATNPSDRIIARARLRGEIEGADAEIVHEAIFAARLVAQLNGRDKIDVKDVPEIAREYVKNVSLKSVMEIEERILKTDLATSSSQVRILSEGVVEAEAGLKILDDLVAQQKDVVLNNQKDLDRVESLRKRELNTESDLSRSKSAAASGKAQLLEIYAEISRSRREIGNLKLQLAKLQADREKLILTEIQEQQLAIQKLISARQSAEEQFFLMAAVAADETKKNNFSFTYEVRRNGVTRPESIKATTLTELLPGDIVVVGIVGM
jgi:protein involved in polysaccharide export with SLBB domain